MMGNRRVTALLEIKGLTKAYPGVVANDDVSFSTSPRRGPRAAGRKRRGQVDAGQDDLRAGAARQRRDDPERRGLHAGRAAGRARLGVAMVFQHFSLFEALSVAENIALGMEDPPKPRDLAKRIHDVSRAYGLPLDPDRMVGDLSAGNASGWRSSAACCRTPSS
jgi:ABC-type sugar transport system ATPase subunit